MSRFFCLLLGLLLLASHGLWADTSFWLKNADQVPLVYWTLPGTPAPAAQALARLPLAPGGARRVLPQERIQVHLAAGQVFVGAFLPWDQRISWSSRVAGGWITAAEAPPSGTLVVDRPSFAAANRGRLLEATLAEWGLEPPQMILDGLSEDWASLPSAVEWGPAFAPVGGWPALWPRLRSLQLVDRDGFWWLRMAGSFVTAPGASASLLLKRPGALLEWPLTGGSTVYLWEGDSVRPEPVGLTAAAPGVVEAALPKDRLSASDWAAWSREPGAWVLAVSDAQGVQTRVLGAFSWETLP